MEKVSRKAINYWRIQAVFGLSIALVVIIICGVLAYFFDFLHIPAMIVGGIAGLFLLYELIYRMWVYPSLFYKYFEFKFTDEVLIVNDGIFNRKHTVIPLFRIQNVDVTEGTIMSKFGLKGISISTAGGGTYIPELEKERADEIRTMIRSIVKDNRKREIAILKEDEVHD
ncbi:PH domain-containing protein [Nosocomiicoccus sp. HMSC09A07]|uniref:PH domain-containing protein n=1 Tax=Nosocomiicoccus sp. HMSC09A07 TaxID=1581145 RepID=UPI0008A16DBE|nr:PH domain-containing protein [Nosocomiicoccus sp. HMSC09A07]OFS63490.1 hypothetical protein HMPREF3177_02800 [Nosocomiicoccus sp. HMSC09A07]